MPHSSDINHQERFCIFSVFEWFAQHPIKVDGNLRLTTHLLEQFPEKWTPVFRRECDHQGL
jgi:hypothetical protein